MSESSGIIVFFVLIFLSQCLVVYYIHLQFRDLDKRMKILEDFAFYKWRLRVEEGICD